MEQFYDESNIPKWIRNAFSIEYLDCRKYTKEYKLSVFDFTQIREEDLKTVIADKKIVCYDRLCHNILESDMNLRWVVAQIGGPKKPISNDMDEIIPHGLVSKYHFPYSQEDQILQSDPILMFGQYIQVLDGYRVYQWKVAELKYDLKKTNVGWFESDYVDLSFYRELNSEINNLIELKYSKNISKDDYFSKVKDFLCEVKAERKKIFDELLNVHEEFKKKYKKNDGKALQHYYPRLSNFDTIKVEKNVMYTKSFVAAIFYKSCLSHCKKIEEMWGKEIDPYYVDKYYEESSQVVVMGVACLEAVANDIGFSVYEKVWNSLEKISLIEKYKLLFYLADKLEDFDTSKMPFQAFDILVRSRNEMVHAKPKFKKVKVSKKKIENTKVSTAETHLMYLLSYEKLIKKVPKMLREIIEKVHEISDLGAPDWIKSCSIWKV